MKSIRRVIRAIEFGRQLFYESTTSKGLLTMVTLQWVREDEESVTIVLDRKEAQNLLNALWSTGLRHR